jgi:hypothetical protein
MSKLHNLYLKYYGERMTRLHSEPAAVDRETENMLATEMLFMAFLLMIAISSGHFLKQSGHRYL